MKQRYRLWQRNGQMFYAFDRQTKKQISLGTSDKTEAQRLLNARNEAHNNPLLNRQIARAYLSVSDPAMLTRTWRDVAGELVQMKSGDNARRWGRAVKEPALETLMKLPLIDTRTEHFLSAMNAGTVSTNVYLRRLHNFAIDIDWVLRPIIPKRQWPKIRHKERRAITAEEHARILARETNPERKALYELCWHLGGSQGDIASLVADDINWRDRVLSYRRRKTGQPALVRIDQEIERIRILRSLPATGPLFPYLRTVEAKDRANEFRQRCHGLGIHGVSLHSYRYSWAERARKCGYPECYAQEALGHGSKAVHRAYAKNARVLIPALTEWERQSEQNNVLQVKFQQSGTNEPKPEQPPQAAVAKP